MSVPWYRDGLRFSCTRCGKCCKGGPGKLRIGPEEIAVLARRLGLGDAEFRRRYVRRLHDGTLSVRQRWSWACVFYREGEGCTVYEDRPVQCRTFPFWPSVIESRESWQRTARHCPGMNTGRLRPRKLIDLQLPGGNISDGI